jgi:Flp pilus assembly protein TadD
MAMQTLEDLERAVRERPESAELRHLLAAEYAQTGQFESAKAEFFHAITLDPQAHIARFQLGLLLLSGGDTTAALRVWEPLELLADGKALKHFKRGLESLARDDRRACEAQLTAGIAANAENPPLNEDMQRILARVRDESSPVRTDFSLYGTTRH